MYSVQYDTMLWYRKPHDSEAITFDKTAFVVYKVRTQVPGYLVLTAQCIERVDASCD